MYERQNRNETSRLLISIALILSACATRPMGPAASATLAPKSGSSSVGTVTFSQKGDGVMVTIDLTGLKPNAEHGFHVHEKGDCASADAMSAGGHFNPMGKMHGAPMGEHHAGDIPNIKTDAAGRRARQLRDPRPRRGLRARRRDRPQRGDPPRRRRLQEPAGRKLRRVLPAE